MKKLVSLVLALFAASASAQVSNRGVILKDEGSQLGFARTVNFVGSSVSCGISGGQATCTFTAPTVTITAGTTATSLCTDGGLIYSLSSVAQCGAHLTTTAAGATIIGSSGVTGTTVPFTVDSGGSTGNTQVWRNTTYGNSATLKRTASGVTIDAISTALILQSGSGTGGYLDMNFGSGYLTLAGYGSQRTMVFNYGAASTSAMNSTFQWRYNPGATSAGFGVGHEILGQSSTTASQVMGLFGMEWTVATHASRTSKAVVQTVNNAGTKATTWEAQNGHDRTVGTAPTVSACGTTPSAVTGSDGNGRLTTGSGALTSCTLTFAIAYNAAPACVANNETSLSVLRAVATTTTLTLDGADITSDVLTYICRGN